MLYLWSLLLGLSCTFKSRDGGIGIRASLRCLSKQLGGGSNPLHGTILITHNFN